MAAYEVLLLNTAVPQIQAAQAGDTYVVPRDIQITANLDVTGNTILGNASTDTVRVNGYMGVGGAPGASTAITVAPTALTGTLQYGVSSQPTGTSAATNSIIAFDAFAQVANAVFTVNNVYGLSVRAGSKGASATATNWHGIQIADQTQGTNNYGITSLVSSGTDKWNIYASGTAANYFAGDLRVGTTTAFASEKLSVLGSTFNDLAAGNGSQNTSYDWLVGVSGNVGYPAKIVIDQGSSSTIHGMSFYTSSAASPTEKMRITAAGNVGIGTSSPTEKLNIVGGDVLIGTDSGSVFNGDAFLRIQNSLNAYIGIKAGTASTAGILFGDTDDSFVGGMQYSNTDDALFFNANNAERLRITNAGNVSIGGTANRATTVGTKALNIFDGTAPAGTLANGISIYSSSGEAYVMDAAGNATLFSPHDAETNEWIFKSKHTPTGKVLKIDVERLLKFVNDHFGLDAVHEFIED